jgi:hypothetical protein
LERNKEIVGCWTRTIIWYEWDNKWYESYYWDICYYTIHPSLVFRNKWYRYVENRVYMGDAYFQKKILWNWEKNIWNINKILTIHRVKKWANNYTYKRFKPSAINLNTLFYVYPPFSWICVIIFELIRKLIYPILHKINKWYLIDKIERIPFILRWYEIIDFNISDLAVIS